MDSSMVHEANHHHVTQCFHEHTHYKKDAGSMGMHLEVSDSTSQEMTLEEHLNMLLFEYQSQKRDRKEYGVGNGSQAAGETEGSENEKTALYTPLAHASDQELTERSKDSLHAVHIYERLRGRIHPKYSDKKPNHQSMTASDKQEEERRAGKRLFSNSKRKRRLTAWIAAREEETDESQMQAPVSMPPIHASAEVYLSGVYNKNGELC